MSSRIGKLNILLPKGVEVNVDGNKVAVKGPKGEMHQQIPMGLNITQVTVEEGGHKAIAVSANDGLVNGDALRGTIRAVLQNHVKGVSEGFAKKLLLVGTGYRVAISKTKEGCAKADLTLGFSHPVSYVAPKGIEFVSASQTEIEVKGADRQLVGQVAADIRRFREPEPYKGKGVRYSDEKIILKEVKKK
jgi:large subunit ribosomal protein L6